MYQADVGPGDSPVGGGGGYGFMSPATSSSGQYRSSSGGGGAPRSAPSYSQGRTNQVGRQPAPQERRRRPVKKAAPKPPKLGKYLAGDSTYQQQVSELRKQLEQFKASNASSRKNVGIDFQSALQKLMAQKTADLGNMQNDFAARGLLNSGLYTDSVNKYNTDYNTQYNDLNTDQSRSLADLVESLSNYSTENSTSLAAARADAIRRRAQQYGITA